MICPVCDSQPDRRFCTECCNDVQHPVDITLPGVAALHRGFIAVKNKDFIAGVNEFRTASRLAHTLPPAMQIMTWFQLALYICKASTGGGLLKMPTPTLKEYIHTLETGARLVPQLPFDLSEPKTNFASWFPQFLGPAYKTLEARGESRVGEANMNRYVFAYPTGAERLNAASTGIRCVQCPNHVIPLSSCANCGSSIFLFGVDVFNATGLFCMACRQGFTFLTCVCGCRNPIQADTIMRLNGS